MTWLNSVSTKAIIYSPLLKCKHWSFELFELERWRRMKILSGREKKKKELMDIKTFPLSTRVSSTIIILVF